VETNFSLTIDSASELLRPVGSIGASKLTLAFVCTSRLIRARKGEGATGQPIATRETPRNPGLPQLAI